DYQDRLNASRQTAHGGNVAWYVYNSGGQRIRKITENTPNGSQIPTRTKERIYIGDFEIFRTFGEDGFEHKSLHIRHADKSIAIVEIQPDSHNIRYQLSNHIRSVCLALDAQAEPISY